MDTPTPTDLSRMAADLAQLSADDLEMMLSELQAADSRVRAVQAMVLREVDRRQVPLGDGVRSLEEWIVGRLDLSPENAHGMAGVARADSSVLDRLLIEDGVSFDRVAEMAKAGVDDPMLELDFGAMRRAFHTRKRIDRASERAAFVDRFLAIQPSLDESAWKMWGRLPALEGKLVADTLDSVADELPDAPPSHSESRAARRADALSVICDRQRSGSSASGTSAVVTTVIVEAPSAAASGGEAGAWVVGGPRVGPATLERLLCESAVDVIARTEDGTPLAVGNASTAIAPRTRRWVLARDGGQCAADGCASSYRIQPHHIRERSDLGDNHPSNLTSLCWYHHHVVVHGRGFRIDPDSRPRRRRFLPPEVSGPDPP